jgi:hypothetical protein
MKTMLTIYFHKKISLSNIVVATVLIVVGVCKGFVAYHSNHLQLYSVCMNKNILACKRSN